MGGKKTPTMAAVRDYKPRAVTHHSAIATILVLLWVLPPFIQIESPGAYLPDARIPWPRSGLFDMLIYRTSLLAQIQVLGANCQGISIPPMIVVRVGLLDYFLRVHYRMEFSTHFDVSLQGKSLAPIVLYRRAETSSSLTIYQQRLMEPADWANLEPARTPVTTLRYR